MRACCYWLFRKEVKELKVEVKRKAEELASTTASLDAAAAETRVVGKEREQMKLEWTQMFSAHDSLVSRIKSLESQLSQTLKQAQVWNVYLTVLVASLTPSSVPMQCRMF